MFLPCTVHFLLSLIPGKQRARLLFDPLQPRTQLRRSILKLQDVSGIPWELRQKAPLFLDNPSNIKSSVIYDPEKNEYILYQKVGAFDYRTPVHMSPEEFRKYEFGRAMRDYWQSRISGDVVRFQVNPYPSDRGRRRSL